MKIKELLNPERIACDATVSSKKRALEKLSSLLTDSIPNLTEDEIFESLIGRERLGSTGIGHGVAIPHARLQGREKVIGAFLKLDNGVDFDSIDNTPVDLLFALLVPDHFTDEHLEILSSLAKLFSDEKLCEKIRAGNNNQQIYELLTS
jgi:PTS system nitrogen regulatory IIA component